MENQEFKQKINKLYSKMEYRPVGVAVLYRVKKNQPEFLIIQSAKDPSAWLFPQGGIEKGEDKKMNLERELEEELGVSFNSDLSNFCYGFHYDELDAESARKDKRGFSKGKAYFASLAKYSGNEKFSLQAEEIADAKWMNYKKAIQYFNQGRSKKAKLSKKILSKANKKVQGGYLE